MEIENGIECCVFYDASAEPTQGDRNAIPHALKCQSYFYLSHLFLSKCAWDKEDHLKREEKIKV